MAELSKEFFVSCDGQSLSFRGHTLLLPCVSVGNVPQLTIDLILNTLRLTRVGWINDDNLLPVIGNDAFDFTRPAGYLHTGAEVYSSTNMQLTVIQLRSPVAKGGGKRFVERLLSWWESAGFDRMVSLSSSHSHQRHDQQLTGSQFRFLHNSAATDLKQNLIDEQKWKLMERMNSDEMSSDAVDVLGGVYKPFLSGSGIVYKLFEKSEAIKLKLIVLNMFCSQGDNMPDAVAMAAYLNDWLKLVPKDRQGGDFGVWIPPQSWSSVYGRPHPRTLY